MLVLRLRDIDQQQRSIVLENCFLDDNSRDIASSREPINPQPATGHLKQPTVSLTATALICKIVGWLVLTTCQPLMIIGINHH